MTTPAVGSVTLRPQLGNTIAIPMQITTSVYSLASLSAAQLLPAIPPAPLTVIVSGVTTRIPDMPGFTVIPPKQPGSAAQIDAIRSAATNTAAAYGLNENLSADLAVIEQNMMQQQIARSQPTVIVEQVIIPP